MSFSVSTFTFLLSDSKSNAVSLSSWFYFLIFFLIYVEHLSVCLHIYVYILISVYSGVLNIRRCSKFRLRGPKDGTLCCKYERDVGAVLSEVFHTLDEPYDYLKYQNTSLNKPILSLLKSKISFQKNFKIKLMMHLQSIKTKNNFNKR